MKNLITSLILSAFFASIPQATSEEKHHHNDHHEAHVHNHAKLELAHEGKKLKAKLELPALNVLGFEHEAKSEKEKQLLADSQKALSEKGAWITAKNCSGTTQVEYSIHGKHAEFELVTDFICEKNPELVELSIFKSIEKLKEASKLEEIEYELVSTKGQKSGELSPENNKIEF